jgi:phage terminase large subunit GpA-like protein
MIEYTKEQLEQEGEKAFIKGFVEGLELPTRQTISQWADRNRVLSPESSAEVGRWDTSRAEYQRGIMDAIGDIETEEITIMTSSQVGKALAVDTPIPTPSGWVLMSDIKEGDIVFDERGLPCSVVFATPVMFGKECFKIIFSDGSSVTADGDHLWKVHDVEERDKVLSTKKIAGTYKLRNRNNYAIPVSLPLEIEEKKLLLDPYLLGIWLGDGNSYSAQITLHKNDLEILKYIKKAGHRADVIFTKGSVCTVHIDRFSTRTACKRGDKLNKVGITKNGYCAECHRQHALATKWNDKNYLDPLLDEHIGLYALLTKLNLIRSKHIPDEYLRASYKQRLALLQGIMDTDGCISKFGRCEITLSSEFLIKDVSELLSTLGIKHTLKHKKACCVYKNKKYEGVAFRISFLAYKDMPIFRLKRKLNKMVGREGRRVSETLRRRIIGVEAMPTVPVRCIQVDSPSCLYLAGKSMIPTHNTEIINNVVGYYIDQDPCPMLLLQPTLELAETWSDDRLTPMLRDTPCLRGKVSDSARKKDNRKLHKIFPGGHITMAGANSPASLSSRPIRIVLCDERDRYPHSAGVEGDPAELAKKRTVTFWNRKLIYASTPTLKGHSAIYNSYEASDRRKYYVPCPKCSEYQVLYWHNVKWDKDAPETAKYMCESCGALWNDVERWGAVKQGHWIAAKDFKGHAGFWLWEGYSPFVKLSYMAKTFIEAHKKGQDSLKVFINTALAECWEDEGERVDDVSLYARREDYGDVAPEGVVVITAGVDVQADRIEVDRYGWGVDEQCWALGKVILYGDPTGTEIWRQLDEVLRQPLKHALVGEMGIFGTGVDCGYLTQQVGVFCRPRWGQRVWALKGIAGSARPIWQQSPGKLKKLNLKFFQVGADQAKETIYSRLRLEEPEAPGYIHFNKSYDEEHFEQLTAEEVVTSYKLGRPVRQWKLKQGRKRNEALDMAVYALAALEGLRLMGLSLRRRLKALKDSVGLVDEVPAAAAEEIKPSTTEAEAEVEVKQSIITTPPRRRRKVFRLL